MNLYLVLYIFHFLFLECGSLLIHCNTYLKNNNKNNKNSTYGYDTNYANSSTLFIISV